MTEEEKSQLLEHLKTINQTLLEVHHAQSCGAGWYTKGDNGLYQQVAMWVQRGIVALDSMETILRNN